MIDGAGTDLYNAKSIDAFGRVRSATYGTVTVAASHADTGRRLPIQLQIILASGDRRVIDYGTFDAAGREASRTETVGPTASSTVISSYDALGRLETSFAGGGALAFNTTFTYDALGNITSLADSTTPQNVSLQYATGANADRDRLCRVDYGAPTVGPCNVRHDDSGNVVEMPTRTGTRVLEYFPSGAIKQIKTADALATFRSDGSGAISELDVVSPNDPRRTRRYGLVERRRLDTGVDILVRNIPGAGGIVASRRGPTGPDITPFGEARGLRFSTDGTSFVQDVDYLPFGQSLSSGDVNARTYTSAQWNGGDNLSDLGVSQLGARIYDPALGRFLSRDPLLVPRTATTTNPYAFAANDPINFSDPSGLDLSICVTSGGNACAAGSDSSTDAEIGAAAAAGVFAIGVRVFGGSGDSSGVSPSYLPRPTSTADSFTQIYAFSALPPEGEDFNATLQKRIPSTPVRSYSYSGPPGFAQVYDFVGWVFGDATDDFDNVPPFRILFRAAIEFGLSGGFSAVGLSGRAMLVARAMGGRASIRAAGETATTRAGEGGVVAATSDSVIFGRSGPYILEGHGWAEVGHVTLPEGTWMWIPDELVLYEDVAQEIARREMFPPGMARLYAPGQRVPNLVLAPGGPGMEIRATSTVVTAPTAISDILVPKMGVCMHAEPLSNPEWSYHCLGTKTSLPTAIRPKHLRSDG